MATPGRSSLLTDIIRVLEKTKGNRSHGKKAPIRTIDLKPTIAHCYSPLRCCCVLSPLCVNNNSVLIIWLVMSSKANARGREEEADGFVPSISDTRVHFDNVSLIKLIHLLIIRSTFWQIPWQRRDNNKRWWFHSDTSFIYVWWCDDLSRFRCLEE